MKWRWVCCECSTGGRKFLSSTQANKHIRKHYERFHPEINHISALYIGEDGREYLFEEDIRNGTIIRGEIQATEVGTSCGSR